jgi:hypothetical protein
LKGENRRWQEAAQIIAARALYPATPILVFLFVLIVSLRRSIEGGRLSIPPFYDDVVYLFYAQLVIHSVSHQSLSATAYQVINQHSPLTTLFGVIGYLLAPGSDIGPYIIGAAHVFLFLVACTLLLRRVPAMLMVGVVCAVGAVPLLRNCIVEFRPEPAWATLTAVSSIAFFAMNPLSASRTRQIGLGLLSGLAVISKPTTGPVTLVILGSAFVASALVQYHESRERGSPLSLRSAMLGTVTIWAAVFLVVVPTGAIIGRDIYNYIIWVMTDVAQQTGNRGGLAIQVLFYLLGPGGVVMLGWALPICVGAWGAGLGYTLLRQRALLPRILAVFAVILISYAIPSATIQKFVWFGAAFDAIFVLATVYLIALLWEPVTNSLRSPKLKVTIAASAGVAGTALLLISSLTIHSSGLLGMDLAARNDITQRTSRIWDVLKKHELVRMRTEPPGHLSTVMTFAVEPIVGPVISLYGVKEDLPIRDADYSYARTVGELAAQLPGMDYVVVGPSYQYVLRGGGLGDALGNALDAHRDFSRIAALPIGRAGALVNVYERKLP